MKALNEIIKSFNFAAPEVRNPLKPDFIGGKRDVISTGVALRFGEGFLFLFLLTVKYVLFDLLFKYFLYLDNAHFWTIAIFIMTDCITPISVFYQFYSYGYRENTIVLVANPGTSRVPQCVSQPFFLITALLVLTNYSNRPLPYTRCPILIFPRSYLLTIRIAVVEYYSYNLYKKCSIDIRKSTDAFTVFHV